MKYNDQLKSLPIGIENFESMIKQDYYYVDKTLLIKELIDKQGYVHVFTRPRRFGKSLTISMLQHYFENLKQDKAHLFDDLKIMDAGAEYLIHQNKYPVIKLILKGAEGATFESAFKMLKMEIAREFDHHAYLLTSNSITKDKKQIFQSILDQSANVEILQGSLLFLSQCLFQHYGEKVIILIDEYDVPLEKAFFAKTSYYDEMVSFIRSFFGGALKTNDALHFSVITGCLRISKESIFTGVNNLNIISILTDSYGEYFGFTQPEVDEMLEYYEIPERSEQMRDWYNGYHFGETIVYNPWSSLHYMTDILYGKMYLPRPHWSNTSSNSIIRQLIEIADDETRDEIELLIEGKTIKKPILEDTVYADITKNMDNLWSFLFFTGYLKKVGKEQIGVQNHLDLKIPNKEVLYIYVRQIREWFDERVKETDMTKLFTAVLNQDVETFEEEIAELLSESISYMDSHENFYHGFLTGVLRGMKGYRALSNRESGNGRGDIFLKPRNPRKVAVILEVKVAKKPQDLEKESTAALKQIDEKKYIEELEQEGYTKIIKYGIAFYGKMCAIKKV